jgi:hypothetical protein
MERRKYAGQYQQTYRPYRKPAPAASPLVGIYVNGLIESGMGLRESSRWKYPIIRFQ